MGSGSNSRFSSRVDSRSCDLSEGQSQSGKKFSQVNNRNEFSRRREETNRGSMDLRVRTEVSIPRERKLIRMLPVQSNMKPKCIYFTNRPLLKEEIMPRNSVQMTER